MSYLRRKNFVRIVISGVANVGTTTVARSVAEGHSPSEITEYQYTLGSNRFQRQVEDVELVIYDLGGQTSYQDQFIGELAEQTFSRVHSFVWVVDSIEIKDLSRAKYYFDQSLFHLSQYSPNTLVFIFLNKIDLIPIRMREEVIMTFRDYMEIGIKRPIRWKVTSILDNSLNKAIKAVLDTILLQYS
ncbi:MAG: ADP-ribosylation factor-like protein [Candidatus Hodarchaeales archaeon]